MNVNLGVKLTLKSLLRKIAFKKNKKQFYFGHLLTLTAGATIYLLFREKSLLMFDWLDIYFSFIDIEALRNSVKDLRPFLPEWFLFSLPDGLWIFSFVSILMFTWDNIITRHNFLWIIGVPILAIFSELGQINNFIPGTFDTIDLLFYIFGLLIPIFLFKK
tara:strand:- start:14 stop:496 length:483 start_codon:yes stop_codon:yes gene_type:complete